MKNWYEKIGTKKTKVDKNFSKHRIKPNSMILTIGGTGTGKSNALVDFLDKKRDAFHDIIIFSGSTTDEPLYNFLEKKIDGLTLINDINDVPELKEFDEEDKDEEKLIVFDDFINLSKKEMKKINEYLTAGRKFGFTCWLNAQNYVSVPKTITRNCHYFLLFKLNDNSTLQNIIRNHNVDNTDKEVFKNFYVEATKEPMNFMMLDLKTDDPKDRLRINFGTGLRPRSTGHTAVSEANVRGSSAKSGLVKKMLYTPQFDLSRLRHPSQHLLQNFL